MVGRITSQGDRAMRSDLARRNFSIDGAGVTIGVISDSFNALGGLASDISRGDLPGRRNPDGYDLPVRVLSDRRRGSDEGRAMLQIIFDVAPGAQLVFHQAGNTEADFAIAVEALTQAGADIIVDDIFYPTEPFLQDGVAAQAASRAVNRGVMVLSAAGNDGNRGYESPFRSGGRFEFRGSTYDAHDFDPGDGVDLFQDIQLDRGRSINLVLNWDQPIGKVRNDLEIFLLDSPQLPGAGGHVLSQATILTDGTNDPSKQLFYWPPNRKPGYLLVAHRSDVELPGWIQWISVANGGDGNTRYQYVNEADGSPGGSTIYGHPNAPGAIAVGAAYYADTPAFGVRIPKLEDFSSRGGVPILFDPQGDRLTSPEIRRKPDLVGPNGVSTTVSGFDPFFGTSAAAPHVAAVAALMLQRSGRQLTPTQLLTALQRSAMPMEPADPFRSGAGFIQANQAVLQSFGSEITGSQTDDWLSGQDNAENLLGWAGRDTIDGAGGLDALFGGSDADFLTGGTANDYLVGEVGQDTLLGGQGRDALLGGEGRDRLSGDQGNDGLSGDGGNDWLDGGSGRNRLIGGAGRDRFEIRRQGWSVITDYQDGQDKLILANNLKFARLGVVQQGRNTLIEINGQPLAQLLGVRSVRLTAADFVSTQGNLA